MPAGTTRKIRFMNIVQKARDFEKKFQIYTLFLSVFLSIMASIAVSYAVLPENPETFSSSLISFLKIKFSNAHGFAAPAPDDMRFKPIVRTYKNTGVLPRDPFRFSHFVRGGEEKRIEISESPAPPNPVRDAKDFSVLPMRLSGIISSSENRIAIIELGGHQITLSPGETESGITLLSVGGKFACVKDESGTIHTLFIDGKKPAASHGKRGNNVGRLRVTSTD